MKPRTMGGKPFVIYPDFTLYIDNKNIYVELLGMMDDSFYKENWSRRLNEYNINGIEQRKELICFSCSNGKEFNCELLSRTLDEIKKGNIPYNIINLDKPKTQEAAPTKNHSGRKAIPGTR